MTQAFVVHHNPNRGRYRYAADPLDVDESVNALIADGESTWVAGNCRRMLRVGDLLLFKFGGTGLRREPGIYAAGRVTQVPAKDERGRWVFWFEPDGVLTQRLMRSPVVNNTLERLVSRSFGASIQPVASRGMAVLAKRFGKRALKGPGDSAARGITHGLLVLKAPLDKILAGTKTWEIRGTATARRGPIALIESKSGHVVGTCDVVDVIGPLRLAELRRHAGRTGFRPHQLPYRKTYAWVLHNAQRLTEPVPYSHPSGAVIWVRLQSTVTRCLARLSR